MKFMSVIAAVLCAGAICVSAAEVKISGLTGSAKVAKIEQKAKTRTTGGSFVFMKVPDSLKGLQIATVYLLVHDRGTPTIPADWKKTSMKVQWSAGADTVYEKQVKAGKIEVPAHNGKADGNYGIPCAVVIKPAK